MALISASASLVSPRRLLALKIDTQDQYSKLTVKRIQLQVSTTNLEFDLLYFIQVKSVWLAPINAH
jgi:hypothetical protein